MNDYLHLFFKLVSSKLFNDFRELKIGIIHMFGSQSNRSDLVMSNYACHINVLWNNRSDVSFR